MTWILSMGVRHARSSARAAVESSARQAKKIIDRTRCMGDLLFPQPPDQTGASLSCVRPSGDRILLRAGCLHAGASCGPAWRFVVMPQPLLADPVDTTGAAGADVAASAAVVV